LRNARHILDSLNAQNACIQQKLCIFFDRHFLRFASQWFVQCGLFAPCASCTLATSPKCPASDIGNISNEEQPDLITAKLPALQFYQLAIAAPAPPSNSFDHEAAQRGQRLFNGKGECSTCYVPPITTEPGWNMHTADEVCIDDFQAGRGPDDRYRTAPLNGS
jgi:hypothetical protein